MSYIPIASQTLTAAAASVTFSSIPTTVDGKTLRDLVLVVTANSTTAAECRVRLNNDSGTNYSWVQMGSTASAGFSNSGTFDSHPVTPNSFLLTSVGAVFIVQIMDYTATDKHKTILSRFSDAQTGQVINAIAGRYASTATITNVIARMVSNNFAAGSTFSLYGIEA